MLVACKAASCTNEASYQFRVIRNMYRIGEAAGIAAALCAKLGTTPRDLDVGLVQRELEKSGALGDEVRPATPVPERPVEDLREELQSNDPKDAVWLLAHGDKQAEELLKDVVVGGTGSGRFWAAVALGWRRCKEALPELMACVSERVSERADYTPRSRNMVPLWQSCIVLLGRIGDSRALPVLEEVLADPTSDMDAIIAVVRAMGRIGEHSAVPSLVALLGRNDIPCERKFQLTLDEKWPASEDGRWQIDLAICETLARLGDPRPDVVKSYLSDPRLHVRKYAQKLRDASGVMQSRI
jgi:HEAT repeat protein